MKRKTVYVTCLFVDLFLRLNLIRYMSFAACRGFILLSVIKLK